MLQVRCVSQKNPSLAKRSLLFFATQATNTNQRSLIAIGWPPIIWIQIFPWNRFSKDNLRFSAFPIFVAHDESQLSFAVTLMESFLKSSFAYAAAALVAACQTTQTSHQGSAPNEPAAVAGPSASTPNRYQVDSFGPLMPPNYPRFQPGSFRGP